MNMQDRYFDERGIAYRTNDFKSGRPAILFIHGLSGSLSAWYPYEHLLSNEYNLITFDLRGHGLSKRWPTSSAYEVVSLAEDANALIRSLVPGPITIVAHSFGAVVARELMRRFDLRIDTVMLLAPVFDMNHLLRIKLTAPAFTLLNALLPLLPIKKNGGRVDYAPFRGRGDWDIGRIRADIGATGLHSYCWSLQKLYEYPDGLWQEFANLRTLIVHGDADGYVPVSHSIRLAHSLSSSKLKILTGANHMLVHNNIREVTELIDDFMRDMIS